MKTIHIEGWESFKLEGATAPDGDFIGREKIREGGILNVDVSSIDASCPINILDSAYLTSKSTGQLIFGEAASAVDRAIELAVAALKSAECARLVIRTKGKFVHGNCREDVVELKCELSYSIVRNGKEAYEYSPGEKLNIGMRYKELAVQKLREANVSYKYPVHLSVFLLIVRGLKWFSAIASDDLESEENNVLSLLKSHCYNNLSHFHLSFGNYERAVTAASAVLNHDSSNIKALYRRAVGNANLQNYELAEADLRLVLSREPLNVAARKQLDIILEKKRFLNNKYAQAMKKFLSMK